MGARTAPEHRVHGGKQEQGGGRAGAHHQELREAEVGRSSSSGDTPQQPSVGLVADRGKTYEHTAGPIGGRGVRVPPRRDP